MWCGQQLLAPFQTVLPSDVPCGPVQLGHCPIILLEITGLQALMDLMQAGHLALVLLVAFRTETVYRSHVALAPFEDFEQGPGHHRIAQLPL